MSVQPAVEALATAALLARGVCRAFGQLGYAVLVEFPLVSGRRADLLCLGKAGDFVIVEIKSSVADFRADRKWVTYRDFADRLYFAVPDHFPQVLIPEECGLMVADSFGAALLREGHATPLSPGRRRALTLRFARLAAARLHRHLDPEAHHLDGL
jgi:hypothetical protein